MALSYQNSPDRESTFWIYVIVSLLLFDEEHYWFSIYFTVFMVYLF